MRGNNILAFCLPMYMMKKVHELTEVRTLASAPFGGRYRLIDFPLSNMVNSGINKVGVITNNNYQSLLDHLGSGKAWDLSRKREGLYILPPFGTENSRYVNRVEALSAISNLLSIPAKNMCCCATAILCATLITVKYWLPISRITPILRWCINPANCLPMIPTR